MGAIKEYSDQAPFFVVTPDEWSDDQNPTSTGFTYPFPVEGNQNKEQLITEFGLKSRL